MKVGINLNINVTNIDKSKLIEGKKGTYLNATVFVDTQEKDQYGNSGMITQELPKEEREAGQKGAILGNCRVFWTGEGQAKQPQQPAQSPAQADNFDPDSIPF